MALSRRTFLRATGVGAAAAVLGGCDATRAGHGHRATSSAVGATPTASPTSRPPTTLPRTTYPPTTSHAPPGTPTSTRPTSLAQLRARLPGRFVAPSDRGYDGSRLGYNPLYDGHRPLAVARCANPADVQACVDFAAASHTPIAARSGGHSYVGYSTPDRGLVVDVGPMNAVQVRGDGTAVIGAGARLIDVYSALSRAGRCLPGGSCPTVGIAGLTLGGGIGLLARKFGLTCDRLVSAQVVTADGVLRTTSTRADPDLFWALRGGGGGNLGIVTSFTYATAPAPSVTVFSLHFPVGSVAGVLDGWQHWVVSAPDELFANCIVSGSSTPSCTVGGCYVGTPAALNTLLDGFIKLTGTAATSRYIQQLGYLDAMRYFAGCSDLSAAQCEPSWTGTGQLAREAFVASSRIVDSPIANTRQVVDAIAGSGVAAIFDSLGGAVARVRPGDTAFPHRLAIASVQIYHGASGGAGQSATAAVTGVRDRLGPLLGSHGYVNYLDASMPDWGRAYYGDNLPRLRAAAAKYDPSGTFGFAQGIARA